jgi:sugar phosphate isomerase/epimerase
MGKILYHSSLEGAQHGGKDLRTFARFAKANGAAGIQPSNYQVAGLTAKQIADIAAEEGVSIDGISAHCPAYILLAAHTRTPGCLPFLPEGIRNSPEKWESWAEEELLRVIGLLHELKRKCLHLFWGPTFGLEMASGYPWPFYAGPGYDFFKEGLERFVIKTGKVRAALNANGMVSGHELHPGTAAHAPQDFLSIVKACDNDRSLGIGFDPTHFWAGLSWQTALKLIGHLVVIAHIKNFTVKPDVALLCADPNWPNRGMEFADLESGDINMTRYVEALAKTGYPARYCSLNGTQTAPLIVEAESAHRDGDDTSARGVRFVADKLCFSFATTSFEEGMGA